MAKSTGSVVAQGDSSFDPRSDPRLGPVYCLAERCCYEVGHAHQVTKLAVRLFDQLHELHGLSEKRRFWLTCAALLHDIGWIDGGVAHHKASLRYILESPLLDWNERQRQIVGSIARYHRKALPKATHEHFTTLKRQDQQDVRTLAGMLRVADALDRSHRATVRQFTCAITDQAILIRCQTRRPAEVERAKALQKADLLEAVFGRAVEIQWRLQ